jgi:phosphoglycolate phosphatase
MRSTDVIIWDWNGTLLDDLWLALEIANGMLARRGLPTMDADRYRAIFDFPVERYYRIAGFDFDREPFPVLADEFITEFNRRLPECRLRERAVETLEHLRGQGVQQMILSASRKESLVTGVEHYGVTGFFDALHGLDDHFAVSKADLARTVAETLPTEPERVVMVGDTLHDVEVAEAMGVRCVLIAGGHQSEERLQVAGVPVLTGIDAVTSLVAE